MRALYLELQARFGVLNGESDADSDELYVRPDPGSAGFTVRNV